MTPALPMGERRLRHVAVSWAARKQTTAACRYFCISWCRDESARVTLELIRGRDASGAAFGGGPVILILHSYFARKSRDLCSKRRSVQSSLTAPALSNSSLCSPADKAFQLLACDGRGRRLVLFRVHDVLIALERAKSKTVDSENTRPVS
jgi:hypothetical protein